MLKHELIRRLAGVCASFQPLTPTEHDVFCAMFVSSRTCIDEKQPLFSVHHTTYVTVLRNPHELAIMCPSTSVPSPALRRGRRLRIVRFAMRLVTHTVPITHHTWLEEPCAGCSSRSVDVSWYGRYAMVHSENLCRVCTMEDPRHFNGCYCGLSSALIHL
jgi:hypothetical protein